MICEMFETNSRSEVNFYSETCSDKMEQCQLFDLVDYFFDTKWSIKAKRVSENGRRAILLHIIQSDY